MEEEVKREEVLSPEVPMNFDSNLNGADAKTLKEENLTLKQQRVCKVHPTPAITFFKGPAVE